MTLVARMSAAQSDLRGRFARSSGSALILRLGRHFA